MTVCYTTPVAPTSRSLSPTFTWNPQSSLQANAALNGICSASPRAFPIGAACYGTPEFLDFANRQPGVVAMTAAEVAARYPMPDESEGAPK